MCTECTLHHLLVLDRSPQGQLSRTLVTDILSFWLLAGLADFEQVRALKVLKVLELRFLGSSRGP